MKHNTMYAVSRLVVTETNGRYAETIEFTVTAAEPGWFKVRTTADLMFDVRIVPYFGRIDVGDPAHVTIRIPRSYKKNQAKFVVFFLPFRHVSVWKDSDDDTFKKAEEQDAANVLSTIKIVSLNRKPDPWWKHWFCT